MSLIISVVIFTSSISGIGTISPTSSHPSISPYSSVTVFLNIVLPEHWYTYDNSPQEFGRPPKINWQLPPGIIPEELTLPTPNHTLQSQYISSGFSGHFSYSVLINTHHIPAHLNQLHIKGSLDWVVCNEVCIPQQTPFSLHLPITHIDAPLFSNLNWTVLILALFGGLILNFMPCVLPILSLKYLTLSQSHHWKSGLSYGIGVLASFWILAGTLFILRSTGHALGWGFQLQSPIFVGCLIALFSILSLQAFGLLNFGAQLTGLAHIEHIANQRYSPLVSSFISGCIAVIVATPCTAPFIGAAIGTALTQPTTEMFLIFTFMAVGFSGPFVGLSLIPKLHRYIPKSGQWLHYVRYLSGSLLLFTTVWLIWILISILNVPKQTSIPKPWVPYTPELVQSLEQNKHPYFINFTAKWCITCQVNQQSTLSRKHIQNLLIEKGYTLILADWTQESAIISQALAKYNRQSIPTYVLYTGKAPPTLLPVVLSPGLMLKYLQ